jgi:cyanophycinase
MIRFRFMFAYLAVLLVGLIAGPAKSQTFDEDFDLWPVKLKIGGTIIAAGGSDVPLEALEYFEKAAGADEAQLLTIELERQESPTSGDDGQANRVSISVSDAQNVTTDLRNQIAVATGVHVRASEVLSKSNANIMKRLSTDLHALVQRGGVLMVSGSVVENLGAMKAEAIADLKSVSAAQNLIPDSLLFGDYDDAEDRPQLLAALAANPRLVGIGLPRQAAIVLAGRKIRVLGEGAATFLLMANERQPLRIQHVKQAESRRANPYETIIDLTAWRRDAIERTLPEFPAAEPDVPHVTNGTLLIVGGGGMPEGLMSKMVELAGGKDARLVYIPCTERDDVDPNQRILRSWKAMGAASAVTLHTKDRNRANEDEAFLQPLRDATGIWFGGGRQWNFCDSYYGTEAHRLMKQVLQRGGVIGGSSAGASVQGRYMCRANPVANFDIMAPGYERGLGFLSGVAIDQHFSQRGRQKDMTQLANRYPQLLGIGIDEATAVIVQKSEAQIVGRGKVFFYDRNRPVTPGQPDYIAVEAGRTFDLARRKIIEVTE